MNFTRRKALTAAGVLSGGVILPGLFKAPANDPRGNNPLAQKVTREAARIRLSTAPANVRLAQVAVLLELIAGEPWFGDTTAARIYAAEALTPFALALRQLWPQTLLGLATISVLGLTVPSAIPYALFIAGGPLLSIPLAVITASPAVGRALVRIGLGWLPEETAPPAEVTALALPAIEMAALTARSA